MNLIPCTICGNSNIHITEQHGFYQVCCISDICTMKSNVYETKAKAIEGWNNVDKYDGVWDPNIVMTKESEYYFDLILKLKESI